jgi:hypothetical protein
MVVVLVVALTATAVSSGFTAWIYGKLRRKRINSVRGIGSVIREGESLNFVLRHEGRVEPDSPDRVGLDSVYIHPEFAFGEDVRTRALESEDINLMAEEQASGLKVGFHFYRNWGLSSRFYGFTRHYLYDERRNHKIDFMDLPCEIIDRFQVELLKTSRSFPAQYRKVLQHWVRSISNGLHALNEEVGEEIEALLAHPAEATPTDSCSVEHVLGAFHHGSKVIEPSYATPSDSQSVSDSCSEGIPHRRVTPKRSRRAKRSGTSEQANQITISRKIGQDRPPQGVVSYSTTKTFVLPTKQWVLEALRADLKQPAAEDGNSQHLQILEKFKQGLGCSQGGRDQCYWRTGNIADVEWLETLDTSIERFLLAGTNLWFCKPQDLSGLGRIGSELLYGAHSDMQSLRRGLDVFEDITRRIHQRVTSGLREQTIFGTRKRALEMEKYYGFEGRLFEVCLGKRFPHCVYQCVDFCRAAVVGTNLSEANVKVVDRLCQAKASDLGFTGEDITLLVRCASLVYFNGEAASDLLRALNKNPQYYSVSAGGQSDF